MAVTRNKLAIEINSGPAHKTVLRRAAAATLAHLPPRVLQRLLPAAEAFSLGISLVTSRRIRALNRDYRHKDRTTDVLSFSRIEHGAFPGAQCDIGDVVIGLEVARSQAKEYGTTLREELQRLTVHGVLHLFGYDHERSARDERVMFALQEKILRELRR